MTLAATLKQIANVILYTRKRLTPENLLCFHEHHSEAIHCVMNI